MGTNREAMRETCAHCQFRQECTSEGSCRRDDALAQAGGTSEFTPRYGDKLRGIWASEKNPQRDGYYVETTHHKTSRYHSARYYRCTDGKGKFWEYPPDSVVLLERAAIESLRTALAAPEGDDAKDAARYRWLRSIDGNGCAIYEIDGGGVAKPFGILVGGHADAAIDSAMSGGKGATKEATEPRCPRCGLPQAECDFQKNFPDPEPFF